MAVVCDSKRSSGFEFDEGSGQLSFPDGSLLNDGSDARISVTIERQPRGLMGPVYRYVVDAEFPPQCRWVSE